MSTEEPRTAVESLDDEPAGDGFVPRGGRMPRRPGGRSHVVFVRLSDRELAAVEARAAAAGISKQRLLVEAATLRRAVPSQRHTVLMMVLYSAQLGSARSGEQPEPAAAVANATGQVWRATKLRPGRSGTAWTRWPGNSGARDRRRARVDRQGQCWGRRGRPGEAPVRQGDAGQHTAQRVLVAVGDNVFVALGETLPRREVVLLAQQLAATKVLFGVEVTDGHVWHLSLTNADGDRALSDEEWARVARR